MNKPPVLRIPKMPSDAIIHRNKLVNDLLEMPSLSESDFKKGLALRDLVWTQDRESIRKEQEEQDALIQQARQDTAREIFEWGNQKCLVHHTGMNNVLHRDCWECWQALKAKYPGNKQNPVGRAGP